MNKPSIKIQLAGAVNRYFRLLTVVILLLSSVGLYHWLSTASIGSSTAMGNTPIIHNNSLPTLMEFGMDTCASCKAMHKVLDELRSAHGDRLRIISVNILEQRELTQQWKIKVIPTQVMLDAKGNEFYRHVGFLPAQAIQERFASHGMSLNVIGGTP
jgi:thioredoxin 1